MLLFILSLYQQFLQEHMCYSKCSGVGIPNQSPVICYCMGYPRKVEVLENVLRVQELKNSNPGVLNIGIEPGKSDLKARYLTIKLQVI